MTKIISLTALLAQADSLKSVSFDIQKVGQIESYFSSLLPKIIDFGLKVILCIILYWVGRKIINYINYFIGKLLSGKGIDPTIASFTKSLINIMLTALLVVGIINKLGIDTTSFAALLASVGVALGMAMSGTLQNFAGGIMLLLFKPFRVGDYIQAQGQEGTVRGIHIFNTEIASVDNKIVFIPNGGLSTNVIVNYNNEATRRIDFKVGVDYGSDYDVVKRTVSDILNADSRILQNPAPFIALNGLNDSSIEILARIWVKKEDYWGVTYDLNENVYKTFNNKGIGIPFPQMTVHVSNN
ncbi:MAG: mechanosensitive ion channel [Dysgonamonadaceae bacterium]|jgi:small conductance mechanosensitive channel|nr:mechanosensitive ion channel [Dysgonamonadaceae bacterium]